MVLLAGMSNLEQWWFRRRMELLTPREALMIVLLVPTISTQKKAHLAGSSLAKMVVSRLQKTPDQIRVSNNSIVTWEPDLPLIFDLTNSDINKTSSRHVVTRGFQSVPELLRYGFTASFPEVP
jgi:hypothetical protein